MQDSPNFIDFNLVKYEELKKTNFKPNALTPHIDLRGHIVWLSPQTEWWTQQAINQDRLSRKAIWPPDPYLIYGQYKTVVQKSDLLKLQGTISEITGLVFEHEFHLQANGNLLIKTTATNKRKEAVSWGLWSNTRIKPEALFYLKPEANVNYFLKMNKAKASSLKYENGYLIFNVEDGSGKLHYENHLPLYANLEGWEFKKQLGKRTPGKVSDDHSAVEIFVAQDTAQKSIIELELLGAYKTLQPNESMFMEEEWSIYKLKTP